MTNRSPSVLLHIIIIVSITLFTNCAGNRASDPISDPFESVSSPTTSEPVIKTSLDENKLKVYLLYFSLRSLIVKSSATSYGNISQGLSGKS